MLRLHALCEERVVEQLDEAVLALLRFLVDWGNKLSHDLPSALKGFVEHGATFASQVFWVWAGTWCSMGQNSSV